MFKVYIKIFSSFNPFGKYNKLRGRYFNLNTISLRRGQLPPFFVTHVSIITWDVLALLLAELFPGLRNITYFNKNKVLKLRLTQCSATPEIIISEQGLGTLFRSVISLMLLTFLIQRIKPVLCYEIFKKWPLLSLFPGCI